MGTKARQRAAERLAVVDEIVAAGYEVRFVEWCEDAETPGFLGEKAGVTVYSSRVVKVRTGLPHRVTLAVLRHELEHVRGADRGTDYPEFGLACGGRRNGFGDPVEDLAVYCACCGRPIVRCSIDHHVSELCAGWRHVEDSPALFHAIICRGSSTADDAGWSIARPA